MNSIIIKVLIGLIVAGGGYYAFTELDAKKTVPTEEVAVMPEKSMSEKLLSGGNWKCNSQIKIDTGNMSTDLLSNQVSYVAGKKIRIDVDMQVSGQKTNSSMLILDDSLYSWVTAEGVGVKMKYNKEEFKKTIDEDMQVAKLTNPYTQDHVGTKYNCEAWTPDMGLFTLPANIIFQDMPQQQGGTANSIRTGNTAVTIESNTGGSSETNSIQVGGVNLKTTKPTIKNNATVNIENGEVKVQGSYGGYSF